MRKSVIILIVCLAGLQAKAQQYTEILGRPTYKSITINVLFNKQVDVYFEYGTLQDNYTNQTITISSQPDMPVEVIIDGLEPETRYYYRTRYKSAGAADFLASPEHTFITQRKKGSTFRFTIEADPHSYDKKGNWELWDICLANQLADTADFMIDLGDTFGEDHEPYTITNQEIQQLHLNCRNFFGKVCHSMPFFFCIGNHEGEFGYYLLQTPPENIATYETLWRKLYWPNPYPDVFYSGCETVENFDMSPTENYFSWEWGDALFVILDVYRYATANEKPQKWDWTIGKEQYDWFKATLENSNAKYKFVFAHHILGQGRGGIELAKSFEWGGYDNSKYKFDEYRPDWGLPIHDVMKQNNVDIFFQGHDHIYVKQELDGIIYQTVPMPSDSSYQIGITDNGDAFESGIKLGGSGHLRLTISPDSVFVEFVNAMLPKHETNTNKNRQILHSYSIVKQTTTLIQQENDFADVKIFPVPADNELNIVIANNPNTVIVELINIEGKIIRNQIFKINEPLCLKLSDYDGQKLKAGIYLLKITTNYKTFTKKIVIE